MMSIHAIRADILLFVVGMRRVFGNWVDRNRLTFAAVANVKVRTHCVCFHVVILSLLLGVSPVFGATYYVAKAVDGGSDINNDCTEAQSITLPKLTVAAGLGCMTSGDTLLIRTGVYSEVPAQSLYQSGTANLRTRIAAYGDGPVVIQSPTGAGDATLNAVLPIFNKVYIDFEDIVFDKNGGATPVIYGFATNSNDTHNIRFLNVEARNAVGGQSGCITFNSSNVHSITISGGSYHDCTGAAPQGAHAVYVNIRDSVFEDFEAYNVDGYCVHQFAVSGSSNNLFQRIYCHDSGRGIRLGGGNDNILKNSIVDSTTFATGGIQPTGLSIGEGLRNRLLSNTVYGTAGRCVWVGTSFGSTTANSVVQNVLCWGNTANIIFDSGTATTQSNNLCTTGCAVSANPNMTDPANGDFTIGAMSSAVGAGITLADVPFDYIGTARPQGAAYDIGAYEFFDETVSDRVSVATDTFTNAMTQCVDAYGDYDLAKDGTSTNCVKVDAATDVAYGDPAITPTEFPGWIATRADSGYLNNQYAACAIPIPVPTSPNDASITLGVGVRLSGSGATLNGYVVTQYSNGSRCMHITKITNGVLSGVTGGGAACPAFSANDVLSIEAKGTQLLTYVNSTLIHTATDSEIPTGKPGIVASGGVATVAALDNCEFGNFETPSGPGAITSVTPISGFVYRKHVNPDVSIDWVVEDLTGNLDLCYSPNAGASWRLIASVPYNGAPYVWTATSPTSNTVLIGLEQDTGTCNFTGMVNATSGAISVRGSRPFGVRQ